MSRNIESFKVLTTLSAYRVVACESGTANTVVLPTLAACPIGITVDTVKDTTGAIPVQTEGIAYLYFNDTCVSGRLVGHDSSGRGVPYSDVTAGGYSIGTLVGPTVAATGTLAQVLISPFWKIIT